ncbi:unnamed protein product (macronuclear) [Paramecium tetraurelia]|uniref:Uncharacterized protein n=1 Tax=Paramecium tetraurelia TaxID=5888 RepID=A0BM86_PARTE|nr:uncharacterized protein GSPATT00030287001 [Paramecium tetraurelia]CAK59653.1 unnamed protein product [Paramecium tetraurelia]|eukprot:XP_001427051.1 hypothetical protein (macronuclear) [Paramecium tetraurelia strain d4-2]
MVDFLPFHTKIYIKRQKYQTRTQVYPHLFSLGIKICITLLVINLQICRNMQNKQILYLIRSMKETKVSRLIDVAAQNTIMLIQVSDNSHYVMLSQLKKRWDSTDVQFLVITKQEMHPFVIYMGVN